MAAAAAAGLAHGMAMPEAVREAQEFTQQALRHAYLPGMGRAIPDRFFWARGKGEADD
jgi:hydroxymethylpyrimidine/phosphomethylpyrimidine kinase